MRKWIVSLLVICLVAASSMVAFAQSGDISVYSDSELLALLEQVQAEIAARHIEKTASLTAGTYIGGKDIPAGSYVLTTAGTEGSCGIISLRSVNDEADDWPSKLYEFQQGNALYSVFVSIDEGDTLILPFPCTMTISSGLMFR